MPEQEPVGAGGRLRFLHRPKKCIGSGSPSSIVTWVNWGKALRTKQRNFIESTFLNFYSIYFIYLFIIYLFYFKFFFTVLNQLQSYKWKKLNRTLKQVLWRKISVQLIFNIFDSPPNASIMSYLLGLQKNFTVAYTLLQGAGFPLANNFGIIYQKLFTDKQREQRQKMLHLVCT